MMGCRGALSSQLGQRKSHHISNFSSAEVVTVVATKITVVSDEHQNCHLEKTKLDLTRGMLSEKPSPDAKRLHLLLLAELSQDFRYGRQRGVGVVKLFCMRTRVM